VQAFARVLDLDREPPRRLGEGALGIAVAERALAGEIAAEAGVQHRRIGGQGRLRIDHCRQWPVLDID